MNKKLGHNFDELKVFSQFYVTFDHLIDFPTELAECISENNSAVLIFVNFEDEFSSHGVDSSADRGTKGVSMTAFITITTMEGTYFKNCVC